MYHGKKISVAVASYNGEKYIKQQIDSICNQTILPDEIIVSDDHSKDNTLTIVRQLAKKYQKENIEIKILENNPRHGYCGNFEWAICHTTGDYIFLSDQDDIWYSNKIEAIMHIFALHPEAECVIHEAELIDENNKKIPGVFNWRTKQYLKDKDSKSIVQLDRKEYLDSAISGPLANGMVLCLTKDSLKTSVPFPKCNGSHDQWILFCSVLNDGCWYTSEIVEGYRLHGDNVCGSTLYRGTSIAKIKKGIKRIKKSSIMYSVDLLMLSESMMMALKKKGFVESAEYQTANRVFEIGKKEFEAVSGGRISGSIQLIKLYKSDIRYRSIGKASFLCKLCMIILHSKSSRKKEIANTYELSI